MERERKAAFPGHFVEMEGAKEKALAAKKAKEEEFKARQRALKVSRGEERSGELRTRYLRS